MPSDASSRSLSVAVLAGGESRRMGTNKALVDFDGEPLVERIAHRLLTISNDVFVVSKRPLDIAVPEVLDELADQTPLSGIITALYTAKHPLVFVCACDMPFVSADLVQSLAASATGVDVAVPRCDGALQQLHAVWSTQAAPKLEAMWADGQRAVHRAIEGLEVCIVDVTDPVPFTNINTPSELAATQAAPSARTPSSWKLSGN